MLIRVPKKFIIDHEERDLPTPEARKVTRSHFWIDTEDEAFEELKSDAEFYADSCGPDDLPPGLKVAAKSLVKALNQ